MSEQWLTKPEKFQPIVKIPLQFHFEPVQILSKQLTKLNAGWPYRIHYLGPRWDDSAILHKKYANKQGYSFNDKEINKNNNLLSQTMGKNQFYKNQVYYRAFQGMNPTIDKQQQLQFNSRFQSGNLDCVVKVQPDQYDLFLRIDSNTRGHLFWFYFQISNCKPDTVVKLNICNITKSIQLYEKGFKPFSCVKNSNGQYKNWSQDSVFEVNVIQKKLRYEFIYDKIKVRRMYELSFKYKFQSKNPVRFAYCIPFTYSQMLQQLNKLSASKIENLKLGSIGRSLTGVQIPFLMIGKDQEVQSQNQQKPVLICIGRLHPGQTNGSHVLSGFMNFVCNSNEADYIRKKVITIFIPMLNPDGVILGNSRTGAIGKDLNRQFKSKSQFLNPQICLLKKFCQKILQSHDIQMFLDFHGHSRKKNMFLFGPNYNITQPQYYRSRVMPRFLSQITPIFRYFGCDYSLPPNKASTARGVMLQQINIPYVFAIQTSIGQYFDYETHKILPFGLKKWNELGADVSKAVKQYFQSVEQFTDFCKSKTNQVEPTTTIQKSGSPLKNTKIPPLKISVSAEKTRKLIPKQKDIKLIKILDQIKIVEQERKTSKKKAQQSDNQSDSQNQQDNLEGKKRLEFEGMVAQCMQTQKKRQQRQQSFEQNTRTKSKKDQKLVNRRKQKLLQKEQLNLMKQLMKNNTTNIQSAQPIQNNLQTSSSNHKFNEKRLNKSQDYAIIKYKQITPFGINKTSRSGYQQLVTQHIFFDDTLPQNTADKNRKNNLNLRMFNFSKIIEQTEGRNAVTSGKRGRNKFLANLRQLNTLDSQATSKQQSLSNKLNGGTLNKISLQKALYIKQQQQPQKSQRQYQTQNMSNSSNRKMKGLYPASFYRIKYQNYQKKKQQRYMDQLKQQNIFDTQDFKLIEMHKKKQGLFLNIKKVDKNANK